MGIEITWSVFWGILSNSVNVEVLDPLFFIDTIESGVMTKDLALLWEGTPAQAVNSRTFLEAIASRMA